MELEALKASENANLRNELISELRKRSNLSIRQIAGMLDVNRGVVQRIRA